ncbi:MULTISPECIES: non-ribosomal peptide synthetase [unclassified Pseudoalteromonas]|uniref:non-ribosomal peptide synthetase n=1 Tax=unclassified Pseudoalteromonas TaxID=194690 RepID=UPI00301420CC
MNKKVLASPIQSSHWIQLKNNPDKSMRQGAISALYSGDLDIEAINIYLNKLVERFDILRTAYEVDEYGALWQRICSNATVDLVTEDWSDYSDAQIAQRKRELSNLSSCDADDLVATPWLRLVIAAQREKHWCYLELPALNCDSFTLMQLLQSITKAGSGRLNEVETWLQDDVIQYEELAPWLADFLLDEELADIRQFWDRDKSVAAFEDKCTLQRYKGESQQEYQDEQIGLGDIYREVAHYAAEHRLTSAEVVCASLRQTLKKFAPKAELARMFDSRSDSDLADVIGPLSRAVPLFPNAQQCFDEALKQEEICSENGKDYAECFSKTHDHETAGFSFIFDSLIATDSSELQVEQIKHVTEVCKLQFMFIQQGSESRLQLIYDSRYIEQQTIIYLLAQIKTTLSVNIGISSPKTAPQYVGCGQNVTATGSTVLDHYNKAVASGEGKVIELDGQEKTLLEVDKAANQLANHLLQQGVGKGDNVALCLARSVEFVISMLAIMKLGATYVPVDVDLPEQRIVGMLKDAEVSTVISLGDFSLPDCNNVDYTSLELSLYSTEAPDINIHEDDLAYILFTSGSTGKAKGVSVSHKALLNHMSWINREFSFTAKERFLQRTSASFDASLWEFWSPLMVGATMVIATSDINYNLNLFERTMQEYAITRLQLVPSLLELLLEQVGAANDYALTSVFCGGEALKRATADKAMRAFNCEVVNLYGPSECCIDALFWRYDDTVSTDFVPIGYPIDNLHSRVIKEDGCLAEVGESGELQIAGDSVFKGYFGQTSLTADAMVYCDTTCLHFYKTGDFVQVLTDGNLMYLDRLDNQVKLNGYRIEPDEVAMVILNAGLAEQAKCVAVGGSLALFYIAPKVSEAELTQLLASKLPEYMMPTQLIEQEAFPYLSNGKLDVKALATIAQNHTHAGFVPPKTAVEVKLAEIWQELLDTSMMIGTSQDFFAIGGHSLLAMKALNRIQGEFNINISVRVLFENKTIADLAAYIEPLLLLNSASDEKLENMEGGVL